MPTILPRGPDNPLTPQPRTMPMSSIGVAAGQRRPPTRRGAVGGLALRGFDPVPPNWQGNWDAAGNPIAPPAQPFASSSPPQFEAPIRQVLMAQGGGGGGVAGASDFDQGQAASARATQDEANRIGRQQYEDLIASQQLQQVLSAQQAQQAQDQSRERGADTDFQASLDRLRAILAGNGGASFDAGRDPESIAFRVAEQRNLERDRQAEAERAAAGGFFGGDFDARLAQLREASGERTSGFEAALGGRRRAESINAANAEAEMLLRRLGLFAT